MSMTPGSPRVFGINVVIRSSGQLGILTKYIPSYGQQIRIIQHNSPFASCLQVYDVITHWNKIPVTNISSLDFQVLVNQSQQNGQFALVIARYSEPLEVPVIPKIAQEVANKANQSKEPIEEVKSTQPEQKKNEHLNPVTTESSSSKPPPTSPPPKSKSTQKQSFEKRLEEFKLYKEKYGTVEVDGSIDKSLKNWTTNVRYAYNKKMESMKNNQPLDMPNGGLKLDEAKIQQLKEAGFRFEKYRNRKKSGNRLYPITSMANDDSSIVKRSDTSEGPEKVRKTRVRKSFEQRIQDMKKFIEENGHSYPSQKKDATLYHWTSNIRNAYAALEKGKDDVPGIKLGEERMKMLNDIGFQFKRKKSPPMTGSHSNPRGSTVDADLAFDKRVAEMKAFIEKNGHSFPSKSHDDPSLINWCANVRSAYRWQVIENISKGMNVSAARIEKLKNIGFDFGTQGLRVRRSSTQNSNEINYHTYNDKFEMKVEELKKFKLIHGHMNVPKYEEYASLHGWIGNVRAARRYAMKGEKKGMKLDEYRIQALDKIGFKWGAGIKAIQNYDSFEARVTMKPPVRSVISTKNADAWLLNSNTIKINTAGHSLLGATIRKSPSRGGFIVVGVGESSPFRGLIDVGEVITHLQGRNMYNFKSTEVAAFLKAIIGGEIYVTLKKKATTEKKLEYTFEKGVQRTIPCPKSNSTLGLALQYIESLKGFLVTGMLRDSPMRNDLTIGDVVTEIDGSQVTLTTMTSLMTNDSDTNLFTIKRIESSDTILLPNEKHQQKERYFIRKGDQYIGSGISKIVGEPTEKGLLISDIDPVGSLTSGIHVGDLIVNLNEDELSFLPPRHKFGRNVEINLNKDDTYNIVFHRADKKSHLQEKSNVLSDIFFEEEVPFLDSSKLPQVQAFDANSKDSIREANASNLKLQKENSRQLLGKRKIMYSLKRSVKPRNFKIIC